MGSIPLFPMKENPNDLDARLQLSAAQYAFGEQGFAYGRRIAKPKLIILGTNDRYCTLEAPIVMRISRISLGRRGDSLLW
jgi:hypothetical protein